MSEKAIIYVIRSKTDSSSVSVITSNAQDALKRARQMVHSKANVTIADRDGAFHTIEELEHDIAAGKYAMQVLSERP